MATGRVLVVEDKQRWREKLEKMLDRAGYQVETAEDIDTAYHKLKTKLYQLVTLDMNLTEENDLPDGREGEELLKLIRKEHPTTQCIVISGSVRKFEEAFILVKDHGAFDFVSKMELTPDMLLKKVEKAIAHAYELEGLAKPQTQKLKIFISYRRSASQAFAARIHDYLKENMTDATIFIDYQGLGVGKFPEALSRHVREADIFLSVISKGTFDRIHESEDWVRREIREGLAAGCKMIPLLEERATFPEAESLPEDVRGLVEYHGFTLVSMLFEAAMDKVIEKMKAVQPQQSS